MAGAKRGGLNGKKGLATLIPTDEDVSVKPGSKDGVIVVNISEVEPNREQPRRNFDEDKLQELAESIKTHGVIQPLLVVKKKDAKKQDYYMIVAGERRWRAANIAGLKEVPVIIRELSDKEIVEISLIENIQREDLNPIEEAQTYKRLLDEFHMKQDEIAERVSKNRTTITNSIRLLKLCDKVQQMLIDDKLTTGHARALIGVEDKEQQLILAEKVFDEKLSVREIEKLVKNLGKTKEQPEKKKQQLEYIYQEYEGKLKEILSTKATIASKENGSGKIEIEFFSHEELDRIMEIITK